MFSAWCGSFSSFSARKTRFLSIFSFKLFCLGRKFCCRSVWYRYLLYLFFVRVGSVFKMYPNPPFSIHFKIVTVFAYGARHGSGFKKIITSLQYSLSYRWAGHDRGIVFFHILTPSNLWFLFGIMYSTVVSLLSFLLWSPLVTVPSSFYDFYILCCGSGYRFGNRIWV